MSTSSPAEIVFSYCDEKTAVTFRLENTISTEYVEALLTTVEEVARSNPLTTVVLDCIDLPQIDTQGIALLLAIYQNLAARDIDLVLTNLTPDLLTLLRISNLSSLLHLEETPEANHRSSSEYKQALFRSYRYAEQLLGALGEAVVLATPEGQILFANEAFCRLSGISNCKQSTPHICDLVQDSERLIEATNQSITQRIETRLGKNTQFPDKPVEVTFTPIKEEQSGVGLLLGFRDISREMLLKEQSHQIQRVEAIHQLAGGIAHEFNNLLTSVLGNVQMARAKGSSDINKHLVRAEQACLRGAGLIKQLLHFSQDIEPEIQRCNLNQAVAEVGQMARELIDRWVHIEINLADHMPPVEVDPSQVRQVLLNLIINAKDAIEELNEHLQEQGIANTSNSHIWLETEFSPTLPDHVLNSRHLSSPHGYVCVRVRDNGIGINQPEREKIFEPFYSTKEVGRGTGLGLAMAYGIVQKHSGFLHCDSVPDEGTCFSIFFPATAAPVTEEAVSVNGQVTPTTTSVRTGNILLVEDEEHIREVAEHVLVSHGHRVVCAGDGFEALKCFQVRCHDLDLVMLDLSIPNLSGFEVFKQVKESNPSTKVIIMSGHSETQVNQKITGYDAFIQKPYCLQAFADLVDSVLNH